MTTAISVRIQDDVKKDLELFTKEEKLEQTSEAARKLLAIGLEEWRKDKAIKLLEQEKITISKAAEISRLNIWDMISLIKSRGIIWNKDKESIVMDIKKALY